MMKQKNFQNLSADQRKNLLESKYFKEINSFFERENKIICNFVIERKPNRFGRCNGGLFLGKGTYHIGRISKVFCRNKRPYFFM
jgi:hypothetical protein